MELLITAAAPSHGNVGVCNTAMHTQRHFQFHVTVISNSSVISNLRDTAHEHRLSTRARASNKIQKGSFPVEEST